MHNHVGRGAWDRHVASVRSAASLAAHFHLQPQQFRRSSSFGMAGTDVSLHFPDGAQLRERHVALRSLPALFRAGPLVTHHALT